MHEIGWLSSVLRRRQHSIGYMGDKRPNQQYQSTEGKGYRGKHRKRKQQNTHTHTQ